MAAIYDERFCCMWEFYLAGCEAAFRHGGIVVFQLQLNKRIDAVPLRRDYIADWERHHAADATVSSSSIRTPGFAGSTPNADRTGEAMCDLIIRYDVHRLVLGFVAGPAARKLQAAGVDIRPGSCACPVEDCAVHFDEFPAS